MNIELVKPYSGPEIEDMLDSFRERYGSFEAIHNKALTNKCLDPEVADDYLIWSALSHGKPDFREIVILQDPGLLDALTKRRIELLEYIIGHEVTSIKKLAEELKRDYKNVYDDIITLKTFGLVETVESGKNRVPIAKVKEICITFY